MKQLPQLLLLALSFAATAVPAATAPGEFILTCLEIPDIKRGAGLAIVLQLPSGETCLYDTGSGYPDAAAAGGWSGAFNAGRDVVLPFLQKAGVRELAAVFISHAHYDHFGGLMWLKDHFPIKKLVDSGYVFAGQIDEKSAHYNRELGDYEKVRAEFKARGAYQEAHTGDVIEVDERLAVEVIAPPRAFFTQAFPELRAAKDPPAHYLVNANSLGLRITHGKTVFLLPGDIQGEDQVLALLPSLPAEKFKCDVLVAPGHGLHAPRQFALATQPAVTLCSVFPRYARTLAARKIYGDAGSKVYVTGLHGWLRVLSDGARYEVTTERDDSVPAK